MGRIATASASASAFGSCAWVKPTWSATLFDIMQFRWVLVLRFRGMVDILIMKGLLHNRNGTSLPVALPKLPDLHTLLHVALYMHAIRLEAIPG